MAESGGSLSLRTSLFRRRVNSVPTVMVLGFLAAMLSGSLTWSREIGRGTDREALRIGHLLPPGRDLRRQMRSRLATHRQCYSPTSALEHNSSQ